MTRFNFRIGRSWSKCRGFTGVMSLLLLTVRYDIVLSQSAFPVVASKKGLQVQMVEDALALGIRHAAINIDLGQLIAPTAKEGDLNWRDGDKSYAFDADYVVRLDRQIKPLSDRGVIVTLILLNYESSDADKRRILLHPRYDPRCPNQLSAFNSATSEGRAWLTSSCSFLAARWSRRDESHGRVWNWVLGNEVNSHWFWSNCGATSMTTFADDYLRTLRLAHEAIRAQSPLARVYVSLEHHWNIQYGRGDDHQCFAARPFLEYLARQSRAGGDFDWHVAFHPYPENLFEPRTWLDKSVTSDWRTSPRITLKNIDVLIDFLRNPLLRFHESPRRVILSEQGFHTPDGPDGELIQAAAYCWAWKRVESMEGIDAFILHRHVDHAQEGGLRLGLWTRRSDSISEPDQKKKIYESFRLADTPEWRNAFEFALPIVGRADWGEPDIRVKP